MMIGNEHTLDVFLGKNKIATLILINDQLHWDYNQAWQKSGYAISPHLALHENISTINVQRFLRNLLPEGNILEELLNHFRLSRSNTFGLIRALGLDTPGSLIITTPQFVSEKASFRIITSSELEQRLNDRNESSLIIWDGKPRLSVAGVQDKINVLLNPEGQLGFGEGSLCSTHILKFEKQKLSHLVLNEFITMQLAKLCGLNVANVKMVRFGKHSALLIERFDRKFISMSEVKRRHIIDGCQALNLSPDEKYERNYGSGRDVAHIREGVSLKKLFNFANQCANPALAKQHMLDWILFNILIFNCDAHGKNISFFVGHQGMTLTPFYDLVNIKMYPDFEQELAMALGDEFDSNAINAYQLADFADSCGLGRSLVAKRLKYIIRKLQLALGNVTSIAATNNEEKKYLERYRQSVNTRCKHLFSQADKIQFIEL